MFRAKYLDGLAELLEEGQLDIPAQLNELGDTERRRRQLRCWKSKPWVVYSKAPFAGPRKLLDYLGRYTHRVAISNHRLLCCEDGEVRFTYRDRRDGDRQKTAVIPADEFIRRFLQHVLPSRFQRIRHYGFLANRFKSQRLAQCRQLLGLRSAELRQQKPQAAEQMHVLLDIDITRCPCCGDTLQREQLPSVAPATIGTCGLRGTQHWGPWDTS